MKLYFAVLHTAEITLTVNSVIISETGMASHIPAVSASSGNRTKQGISKRKPRRKT